jgi:hypothetical protein
MSRDTDWHVFDKACEVAAMALRGTADEVAPDAAAALFAAVYGALREAASSIEAGSQKAGF